MRCDLAIFPDPAFRQRKAGLRDVVAVVRTEQEEDKLVRAKNGSAGAPDLLRCYGFRSL